MCKKIFLIFSVVFALFICSTTAFATTETIVNGMNDAGNTVKDSWNKLGNSVQNAGNSVTGAISNMGQSGNTENGNRNENTGFMGMTTNNDDNNYTARRTSSDGNALGMSETTWTWVILAILGIGLVALIWSFGSQSNKHED